MLWSLDLSEIAGQDRYNEDLANKCRKHYAHIGQTPAELVLNSSQSSQWHSLRQAVGKDLVDFAHGPRTQASLVLGIGCVRETDACQKMSERT